MTTRGIKDVYVSNEELPWKRLRDGYDFKMNRQWQIRAASPEDSGGLQACMESAYAGYQERLGGKLLPPMDLDYSSEIRDFPVWVAECENRVVGGLIMMFEDNHALVANVAVHPDFQGIGLGGGLMEFAETKAKQQNYSELRLTTHVLLNENISLYLHLGWMETSRDDTRVYMNKHI